MRIAVDGPVGSGKTTIAQRLAQRLGFDFLSTGLMYRYVGLMVEKECKDVKNIECIKELLKRLDFQLQGDQLFVDGRPLGSEVKSEKAGEMASKVAVIPEVREVLTTYQRRLSEGRNIVVEGRDIGTVVLPDAEVKIYLTASAEERAKRRYEEMRRFGLNVSYEEILKQIKERDLRDTTRKIAPLKPAKDAVIVDTTGKSIDQVVEEIVNLVVERKIG